MLSNRVLFLVGVALTLVAAEPATLSSQQIATPAVGSAARRAILSTIRSHLGVESKFQVQHLKTSSRWAYIRASEIVDDSASQQETKLSIATLLERGANGWNVVELWSLPGEEYFSFAEFTRVIRERQTRDHIPAALFPPEL
ncbi:MAG: hypothetical protein ABI613_05195 [Gemmatimonadota bacterium]